MLHIKPAYKDYYQKLGKLGKKIQKKILGRLVVVTGYAPAGLFAQHWSGDVTAS